METQVFLSYSSRDHVIMQTIYRDLTQAGFVVWIDKQRLEPGTPSWRLAIQQALNSTGAVVVLLSPDAAGSKWVGEELAFAENRQVKVFPLLVRGSEHEALPFGYVNSQYIDLQRDYVSGMARLVDALHKHPPIQEFAEAHARFTREQHSRKAQSEAERQQRVEEIQAKLQRNSEKVWLLPTTFMGTLNPINIVRTLIFELNAPNFVTKAVSEPYEDGTPLTFLDWFRYDGTDEDEGNRLYQPFDDEAYYARQRTKQRSKKRFERRFDSHSALIITLLWLPILMMTVAAALRLIPLKPDAAPFIPYPVWIIIIVMTWLLTNQLSQLKELSWDIPVYGLILLVTSGVNASIFTMTAAGWGMAAGAAVLVISPAIVAGMTQLPNYANKVSNTNYGIGGLFFATIALVIGIATGFGLEASKSAEGLLSFGAFALASVGSAVGLLAIMAVVAMIWGRLIYGSINMRTEQKINRLRGSFFSRDDLDDEDESPFLWNYIGSGVIIVSYAALIWLYYLGGWAALN